MSMVDNLFEDPRHDLVTVFLLQVPITLTLCKLFTKLLSYIPQPAVIGQILAGIVLGPSGLGLIPGFNSLASSYRLVSVVWPVYGFIRWSRRTWARYHSSYSLLRFVPITPHLAFCYAYLGSGVGFSAFPVLASILQRMSLITTKLGDAQQDSVFWKIYLPSLLLTLLGVLTMSIAAIEDIAVWVVLAIASASNKGDSAIQGLYTLLLRHLASYSSCSWLSHRDYH